MGVTGSEEEVVELAVDIESVEEGGVAIVGARGVGVLAVGLRPSRRTTSVLSTSIGERREEKVEKTGTRTLYKHAQGEKAKTTGSV